MGSGAELGELTPRQIVEEIDKYVVGQAKAKRSVAIALRNRHRRQRVPGEFREEIAPKNILMMGPTGVGKTEIARRVARLVNAPFVKVEATKFTEVGYVGRDVDAMVRDLVETSIRIVKAQRMEEVREKAALRTEERLLDLLAPLPRKETVRNPFEAIFGGHREPEPDEGYEARVMEAEAAREEARARLAAGDMEDQMVDVEIDETATPLIEVFDGANVSEMGINMQDLFGGMFPKKKKRRRVSVSEARQLLLSEEAQKLIDMDAVSAEAIRRAEQSGIIFIDEMDKIAGREGGYGPDVSREGVQRDLLPIVEGSTVVTKYGPVKTDHILFIAAGAFHSVKPSDLVPELQGRFPIRVELEPLGKEEFRRILTEPKNALVKQYRALLETEGVNLEFLPEAVDEIAGMAARVNEQTENIGARRLHTIMERLLEDLLFEAPEAAPDRVVVDAAYVKAKLEDIVASTDVSKYIL
ncbi:MAG: ATP-dependent protease ATPase subunit HslU [Ignavibacteriales bacterium]